MGKALRGLVFVILALGIVSLVFAILLFNKRELLMKRNESLEAQVIKLAKTIEEKDPDDAAPPELMKDISEVTDRELADPEKDSVLANYPIKMETQNLATFNLDATDKRLQLRSYYQTETDPKGNLVYVLDPVTQKPTSHGPGTMNELLDKVVDRAKNQQANFNKTRAELTQMRERFTESVGEINKLKDDGRKTKRELKAANEEIVSLNGQKDELEGRVAKLNAEKKELSAELADTKNEVDKLNEEKISLSDDLARAHETIEEMKKRLTGSAHDKPALGMDGAVAAAALTAGDKGEIIAANDDLKFVIINFSPDAILEMLGPERENPLPQLVMNIRRKGRKSAAGDFVTRIKLRQIVRDKNLVVADIMNDWQQAPVEKGDVVFF